MEVLENQFSNYEHQLSTDVVDTPHSHYWKIKREFTVSRVFSLLVRKTTFLQLCYLLLN